jgi:hypothetical protein
MINKKFLFNFSVSYSGGGFKRLYAYAQWFNQNGGATFIVHPSCSFLINEFPRNNFIVVNQSKLDRLFNDCQYLVDIRKEMGIPAVYYSYGIPIYYPFGKINWFHLSNVLPLGSKGIPLSLFDKLKLGYLGRRIEKTFNNADIISAESQFSLDLIKDNAFKKLVLSVNGSDDELMYLSSDLTIAKENIAVVLGTYRYKAIADSYRIFETLKEKNSGLKLVIIGNEKMVPKSIQNDKQVIMTGLLKRDRVIEYLHKSEYYISATHIENSYNAASEGIFFANESFISDIGPHRELLSGLPFETVSINKIDRPLLRVKKGDISPINLKYWDNIIVDMLKNCG